MNTNSRSKTPCRSRVAFGILLASCLGFNLGTALAGEGSWIKKADLPMALGAAAACEVDGILYLAGGETNSWDYPVRSLLAYDPKTDTWTRKADMPTKRSGPVAAAVDGIIYVIGGGNLGAGTVTPVVEAYDPKTDTWTTKAPVSTARIHADGCVLDGLIYVIGGMRAAGDSLVTVECYDPKTDQWTRKEYLPQGAGSPVVQVVDGTIYAFYERSTFAYDPAADQWTSKAQIPGEFEAIQSAGATVDGLVYLFGGLSTSSLCGHNLALAYDPVKNQFASRPEMPERCVIAASAMIGGKIYVAGGATGHPTACLPFAFYDSLWVFDPQDHPGSWTRKADMPIAVAGAAAAELDGILYVAGGAVGLASGHATNAFFAYHLTTDSWTREADMPTARGASDAVAVDGIVYVIGGGEFVAQSVAVTKVVEAYDPKTDTWTAKTPMHSGRFSPACCTLKGLVYAIGGIDANLSYLATVECYDPKTDQWTPKRSLPLPCEGAVAQVVNDIIYVFSTNSTFAYDSTANTWISKAPLPTGFCCQYTAAGTVNGLIYLLGGLGLGSDSTKAHALSLAYDPEQDRFSRKRMVPVPCGEAAAATVDGKIYLAGGFSGNPFVWSGAVYYDSLWVFDPQGGEYPRILSFSRPSNDTVRLVWQIEAERIGRSYGIQSKPNVLSTWGKVGPTVQATNTIMETTLGVSPSDTARFYQVYEAN